MSDPREENPLMGIDAPRPLPADFRARLEEELVGGAVAVAVLPDGIDRPRPIPPPARERIERAVLAEGVSASGAARRLPPPPAWARSSRSRQLMPLAAAVLVLILGVSAALTLTSSDGSRLGSDALTQSGPEQLLGGDPAAGGVGPAPPFSDTPAGEAPTGARLGEAAPGPGVAASDRAESDFTGQPSAASAEAPSGPVRIGLSGPDNQVAQGFRSYLNTVNAQGGIGGRRRFETVNPSSTGLMATVNTSLVGPLDPRSAAPRLEGPGAPEARLRGDTFSFASAPERLAHLLADALYPTASPGASVVIFTGEGVYDEVVPAALEAALREKGVLPTRVATRSGRPGQWPQAEVAVLSLNGDGARNWLAAAREQGYRNPRGVAGLWGLAEPALVAELPEGSTVVTSYATPRPQELEAMTTAAGGPPSFGFVHGWATAKALALALWQSGAGTPEELTRALTSFPQDDLGGLIAPYRVRPGTNSRTPEGLVLQVRDGSFVPQGGFRADPRT